MIAKPNQDNFTLLVVDDEAFHRQILIEQLSSQTYTILQATSGLEAITYLRQGHRLPDMILLEVMMPEFGSPPKLMEVLKFKGLPFAFKA